MEHSVALVDDHHLMRDGLATMINALVGYTVTVQAENGKDLIEQLSRNADPKIAIIDLHMPVMDGFDTLKWLRINTPEILPLALTFDASDQAMTKAIRSGARGFITKNARPPLLKAALDSLVLTGYYYSDDVHNAMLQDVSRRTHDQQTKYELLAQISEREMEFLLLVCSEEEHTYENISKIMGVHRRTVDNYRISLFVKFNLKSKIGLVLFAMRWGLIK